MRVLIVKMSSMGDVIHTLPALTDATRAIKTISFDWVVEENFQEIPHWHSHVNHVIPIALRRWRKNIFAAQTRDEWRAFKKRLRENQYDLIIDVQGLLKSAFISCLAKGVRAGYDFQSARESWASIFYQQKFAVAKKQHAITRTRNLFSQALGYALPTSVPEYGVDRNQFRTENANDEYLVFLHGTTWDTKHWPEEYWHALAKIAEKKGYKVKIPWGNATEHARAERIAAASGSAEVLPKLNLKAMAQVLASAKAVVAVDTGLCHLTAALDVPAVSLYGPTNPELSGALGRSQKHLKADFPCSPCLSRDCTYRADQSSLNRFPVNPPCFAALPPVLVWAELEMLLESVQASPLREAGGSA
jgi:heptosyltransferase-1